MKFPKLAYKRRTARRLAVVSGMALLAVAAFGASLVFAQEAQEGRAFLVWSVQTAGGAQVTDEGRNIMQGLVGQPAVGTMFSDDDDREQFELTLGFHTGVMAGPEAFAGLVQNLALTPLPTPATDPTGTPTPEPEATPTEVPSSPTATTDPQAPAATATAEPQPSTATATPVPPSPTAVSVPTRTPTPVPPTATATLMPLPADTPAPTQPPPPSPTSEPTATRTPIFIVVTSPPAEQPPTATATPVPASGGICSVPGNGPRPLDVGLLLILAAPIALWRFGIRP